MHRFRERRENFIAEAQSVDAPFHEELPEAIARLDALTRERCVEWQGRTVPLADALERAADAGEARGPVTRDVVVHPGWVWDPQMEQRVLREFPMYWEMGGGTEAVPPRVVSAALERWRQRFVDAMWDVFQEGRRPLVVEYERAPAGMPFRYDVRDAVPSIVTDGGTTGALDPAGLVRSAGIQGGLNPHDHLWVHGAAYLACPSRWAEQQAAASLLGLYLPDCAHEGYRRRERWTEPVCVMRHALHRGALRWMPLRAGTVFDAHLAQVWNQFNSPGEAHLEDGFHGVAIVIPGRFPEIQRDVRETAAADPLDLPESAAPRQGLPEILEQLARLLRPS